MYGIGARLFHWSIAALVAVQIPRHEANQAASSTPDENPVPGKTFPSRTQRSR